MVIQLSVARQISKAGMPLREYRSCFIWRDIINGLNHLGTNRQANMLNNIRNWSNFRWHHMRNSLSYGTGLGFGGILLCSVAEWHRRTATHSCLARRPERTPEWEQAGREMHCREANLNLLLPFSCHPQSHTDWPQIFLSFIVSCRNPLPSGWHLLVWSWQSIAPLHIPVSTESRSLWLHEAVAPAHMRVGSIDACHIWCRSPPQAFQIELELVCKLYLCSRATFLILLSFSQVGLRGLKSLMGLRGLQGLKGSKGYWSQGFINI